jgi:hypothetical protein
MEIAKALKEGPPMSLPPSVTARLIAAGAALALLAGCSSPNTSTPTASPSAGQTKSVSPACAAASEFSAALTNFKDTLKPSSTVEQIQSARDQVRTAYDNLVTAAADAAKGRVDAVKAAEEKFVAAVNAVPNDATVSQAANSLRDEAANVQGALSDLMNEVKC